MDGPPGHLGEGASSSDVWRHLDGIPLDDWNVFLHELRGRRVAAMPPGARTVLSAGCAGAWYFEWFAERYPTSVERHIGFELFSPRPTDLPGNVEWIPSSLDDLSPVESGVVDLVFAGQVIEHLWPDEHASFLLEAHRVLRPGGYLVADSPSRSIAAALGWTQPEHTVELDHDEFRRLLEAAGFAQPAATGLWLCRDPASGETLPLPVDGGGDQWPWQRRVTMADKLPEHAFVWWVEARRSERPPDPGTVERMLGEIFARERPRYFRRLRHEAGTRVCLAGEEFVEARPGESGYVLRGPSIALPPGVSIAAVWLASTSGGATVNPAVEVARVDVACGEQVVAATSVTAGDLQPESMFTRVMVPYQLDLTAFAGEIRVRATGAAAVAVRSVVGALERLADESTAELAWPSPPASWTWGSQGGAKHVEPTRGRRAFRALRRRARGGVRFLASLRGRAVRRVRV